MCQAIKAGVHVETEKWTEKVLSIVSLCLCMCVRGESAFVFWLMWRHSAIAASNRHLYPPLMFALQVGLQCQLIPVIPINTC
jgi:hypothetical protein